MNANDQTGFQISDLDFELPESLIAQAPTDRRDGGRLLYVDRAAGTIEDKAIDDLPSLLARDDLLILNNTKVVPAKFLARRDSGGAVPGLFVAERSPGLWRVMLQGSRRLRVGEAIHVAPRADAADGVSLTLVESLGEGHWLVRLESEEAAESVLQRVGFTPLPPYIRRGSGDRAADDGDRSRYQTVFAERPGAIAAPTAGLHFTDGLLDRIEAQGVRRAYVTLHVGLGTFKPVSVDRLVDHQMHSEWYELSEESAGAVQSCRARGGRVVAVGTTSVRVLESVGESMAAGTGDTDIFIYPPYSFRAVDCLLTNFHLPRSTLLALVMAFGGEALVRRAYRHAVDGGYRFYSYGDAMLVV